MPGAVSAMSPWKSGSVWILLKVNNEAILKAMRLLSQEGIFAQPASATALAGLIEAAN